MREAKSSEDSWMFTLGQAGKDKRKWVAEPLAEGSEGSEGSGPAPLRQPEGSETMDTRASESSSGADGYPGPGGLRRPLIRQQALVAAVLERCLALVPTTPVWALLCVLVGLDRLGLDIPAGYDWRTNPLLPDLAANFASLDDVHFDDGGADQPGAGDIYGPGEPGRRG